MKRSKKKKLQRELKTREKAEKTDYIVYNLKPQDTRIDWAMQFTFK